MTTLQIVTTLLGVIGFCIITYAQFKVFIYLGVGSYTGQGSLNKWVRGFINRQYNTNFSKSILSKQKYKEFIQSMILYKKIPNDLNYIVKNGVILHRLNLNDFDDEVTLLTLFLLNDVSYLKSQLTNDSLFETNFNILSDLISGSTIDEARFQINKLYNNDKLI